jgi:hypothetical protein
VSHLVVLKASQVALTAIPSKYPDGYRCRLATALKYCSWHSGLPLNLRPKTPHILKRLLMVSCLALASAFMRWSQLLCLLRVASSMIQVLYLYYASCHGRTILEGCVITILSQDWQISESMTPTVYAFDRFFYGEKGPIQIVCVTSVVSTRKIISQREKPQFDSKSVLDWRLPAICS